MSYKKLLIISLLPILSCLSSPSANSANLDTKEPPFGCFYWFDGCNKCRITNDGWDCTMLGCIPQEGETLQQLDERLAKKARCTSFPYNFFHQKTK
jgi:hypothetical protein